MEKEKLKEMAKQYAAKIANAKNKNEENKLIGELLEDLVQQIFWYKGYRLQCHNVEDRRNPDIWYSGFIMEIGNTKKYNKKGQLVEYSPRRQKAALRHLKMGGYKNNYYLISHATALKKSKKKLEKENITILEIGAQVTPKNLVKIYPRVRKLIDTHIVDVPKERNENVIITGYEELSQEEKFEDLWCEIYAEHTRGRLDIESDPDIEELILNKTEIKIEKREIKEFFKWLNQKFGSKKSRSYSR